MKTVEVVKSGPAAILCKACRAPKQIFLHYKLSGNEVMDGRRGKSANMKREKNKWYNDNVPTKSDKTKHSCQMAVSHGTLDGDSWHLENIFDTRDQRVIPEARKCVLISFGSVI